MQATVAMKATITEVVVSDDDGDVTTKITMTGDADWGSLEGSIVFSGDLSGQYAEGDRRNLEFLPVE